MTQPRPRERGINANRASRGLYDLRRHRDSRQARTKGDPHEQLAAAILLQAYSDIGDADKILALDALLWLAGPDAITYSMGLELETDPLTPIVTGTIFKTRRANKWRQPQD